MNTKRTIEPLNYGVIKGLEAARAAADDARREGLQGHFPAACVVLDMALSRALEALKHIECERINADPKVPEGWISVKDRLPDDDCIVLVADWFRLDGTQHIDISSFRHGGGYFSGYADGVVTHWMPLPSAPSND